MAEKEKTTKELLFQAAEQAMNDGEKGAAQAIGGVLTRFYRGLDTHKLIQEILHPTPKAVIETRKATARKYTVYTPGMGKNQAVAKDLQEQSTSTAAADTKEPTIDLTNPEGIVDELMALDVAGIKEHFGTIGDFKNYTSKNYGVNYGNARNGQKVLEIFSEFVIENATVVSDDSEDDSAQEEE